MHTCLYYKVLGDRRKIEAAWITSAIDKLQQVTLGKLDKRKTQRTIFFFGTAYAWLYGVESLYSDRRELGMFRAEKSTCINELNNFQTFRAEYVEVSAFL